MSIPRVECVEVTKSFGPNRAVDGVSLTLEEGAILALVGPSGCGKTTLLRLIAGFEAPDSGSVLLGGEVVSGSGRWAPPESRRVGMVFQDYALFPHMTVADNVAFGMEGYKGKARDKRVQEALQHAGIGHLARRYPHQLSGGEQQRVALVRSIASRPLVLLLDEPFSNLDPQLRLEFRRELKRLIQSTETPAIYVTHDHQDALYVGDRVAVMNQGRLEQVGLPEEIYEHPASRFTADFLGPAIFMAAEVTPEGFLTEVGLLRQKADSAAVGSSVDLLVRPDDLLLTPAPDGVCWVVEHQFHGTHRTYMVQLPSGQQVQAMQPHLVALAEGERVSVSLDPGHQLCFFPREPKALGSSEGASNA